MTVLRISGWLLLGACSQGYTGPADDTAEDSGADTADTDTDTDDSGGGGEDSGDTDTDTGDTGEAGTSSIVFSLSLSAGDCADMRLSLTRVTYQGEYFDYDEALATAAFDDSCEATLSADALVPETLSAISDDLGALSWGLLLPTVYTATGATLQISHSASPAHTDGSFAALDAGYAYVGISDALLFYVEGDVGTLARELGLEEGWGVARRAAGQRELSILSETDDEVTALGETIRITLSDNLAASSSTLSLSGDSDRDSAAVSLAPYPWYAGDSAAEALEASFSLDDGGDWSLEVAALPLAAHYLPTTSEDGDTVFDTCCREAIPVAVEVPVVDDGEDSVCRSSYAAVLLHYAEPTHLWAAEWYHLNDELPGWRVRYEYATTSWKTLDTDDYGTLNLDAGCTTSDTFTE